MDEQLIKTIKEAFNSVIPLSDQELQFIIEDAKVVRLPKKTTILDLGETCKHMYYVIKGCLRLFYLKDGVERNCFFFHENLFCTAFGSFMMQQPSIQIMETVEDCVCLRITHQNFEKIYTKFPKMNVIVRKILEERYANAHDILASFILHSPEERYLEFIKKYPLLVNRMPQYHIASYLGITPKSFSRLKSRIQKKNSI